VSSDSSSSTVTLTTTSSSLATSSCDGMSHERITKAKSKRYSSTPVGKSVLGRVIKKTAKTLQDGANNSDYDANGGDVDSSHTYWSSQVEFFDKSLEAEGRSTFYSKRRKKKSSIADPSRRRGAQKVVSFAIDASVQCAKDEDTTITDIDEMDEEKEDPQPQANDLNEAVADYEFDSFSTMRR
jgi:hypothetical protein